MPTHDNAHYATNWQPRTIPEDSIPDRDERGSGWSGRPTQQPVNGVPHPARWVGIPDD